VQLAKVLAKVLTKFKLVGITIVCNLVQLVHMLFITVQLFCALLGRVIEVILVQPEKVLLKFVIVHPEGITIDVNETQLLNVPDNVIELPTVDGNVIFLNNVLLLNAEVKSIKLGIDVGRVILVIDAQLANALDIVDALRFDGNTIFFKFTQLAANDDKS
jgi:hypothetical protein